MHDKVTPGLRRARQGKILPCGPNVIVGALGPAASQDGGAKARSKNHVVDGQTRQRWLVRLGPVSLPRHVPRIGRVQRGQIGIQRLGDPGQQRRGRRRVLIVQAGHHLPEPERLCKQETPQPLACRQVGKRQPAVQPFVHVAKVIAQPGAQRPLILERHVSVLIAQGQAP